MKRNSYIRLSENTDDVLDKAGWMYADLFLALMVIFLATISFVPSLTKLPSNASGAINNSINLDKLNFQNGLVTTYKTFNLDAISKDVLDFKVKQHLPLNANIIYTQIVGGYNPKIESANKGTLNAIAFSIKLKNAGSQIFGKSAISIDTSPELPSGEVAIRSTFSIK